MTIQDALKLNQPFKRASKSRFQDPRHTIFSLTKEDVLADDWEVQKTVPVSYFQLAEALEQSKDIDELAKKLGLI